MGKKKKKKKKPAKHCSCKSKNNNFKLANAIKEENLAMKNSRFKKGQILEIVKFGKRL